MPYDRPMTTKTRRPLTRQILWAFAPVIALLVGALLTIAGAGFFSQPEVATNDSTSVVNDQVAELIEHHDCWTSEGPEGVIPGHVVYADQDGRVALGGPAKTGLALEQVFDGADHGMTVFGFCR